MVLKALRHVFKSNENALLALEAELSRWWPVCVHWMLEVVEIVVEVVVN